jgi:hypothetical protein
MPTAQYTALANATLGSSAASVTFSSINGTYRDLMLVLRGVGVNSQVQCLITVNSDTGTNYTYVSAGGDGTVTNSYSGTGITSISLGQANTFVDATGGGWSAILNFMDYSATDKHKNILVREIESTKGVDMYTQKWSSLSAITSLSIALNSGSWNSGSNFALYGVK